MKIDLHNHTTLCNHAEGTVDEYVQAAIAAGIDVFGFSDHAPMAFDPKYRMQFEEMEHYHAMVMDARAKYEGSIDILFGYEVDYLEGHMDERVLDADVDYLIGSVHFLDDWGFDNPEFIGQYAHENIDVIWERYFGQVEAMAKSGHFDIVGHLDLIKVFKFMPERDIVSIAGSALDAVAAAGMTMEINVAGYRKPVAEAYPSPELLRAAFERGIPVTFGSDAHAPGQIGLFRDEAEALAREAGYTECVYFRNRKAYSTPL
ncbi:histidinol-phosphatase HisJ family protein [Sulfurimonas sp. HSL1-2]|uniref:histidinol-phosphatase HisJ family protein n=1 Tax=Thiomicrolovo zhangzhouensis TaxID=3131933 RepID=UPI0031F9A0DB